MNYYVYMHICPNGKRYVGITTQRLKSRWRKGKGYINNKHFYNAILKYGWDNIEHLVYKVDTDKEMFYLEKYLIAYYNTTDHSNGYNFSKGGEYSSGWRHTTESKSLIAKSKYKPILQLSMEGVLIKEWSSMMDAAEFYGCTKGNISACCQGRSKSARNFIWKYKN